MKLLILFVCVMGAALGDFSGELAKEARHNGGFDWPATRWLPVADTLPPSDSVLVGRMIRKLTDSLGLSAAQQVQIGPLCYLLDSSRLLILQRYIHRPDSLGHYLQLLEDARDSCMMSVLSDTQYRLYGQKKSLLVLNN